MKRSRKRKYAIIVTALICCLMISCARERGRTDINLEMTDEDSVEAIIDHDLLTAGGTIVNLEEPEQTEAADAVTEVEEVELQTPVVVEPDQSLKPAEDTDTDSAEQPAMGLIDIEDVEIDSGEKTKEDDLSKTSSDEETLSTEQLIAENQALISAEKESKTNVDENSLPGDEKTAAGNESSPQVKSEKKNENVGKSEKTLYQPAAIRPPNGSYYTEYTTMAETVKPAKSAEPTKSAEPAKSAEPVETADVAKDASSLTHTVKRGDTLWLISKEYGCTISELVAENEISRRSVLKIGQIIKIPKEKIKEELIQPAIDGTVVLTTDTSDGISSVTAKVITEAVEKEVESPQSSTEIYTVKSGDSYWKIAKKYGVTSTELMSLNNTSSSMIRVGQKILVPKKLN